MIDGQVLWQELQDRIDKEQTYIDTFGNIGALVYHECIGKIVAWKQIQLVLSTAMKEEAHAGM